jgi:hypothetical protein
MQKRAAERIPANLELRYYCLTFAHKLKKMASNHLCFIILSKQIEPILLR